MGDRDRDDRPKQDYGPNGCKVFIGNLDDRTSKGDLEDFFRGAGTVSQLWIARNPPGFGFVEFEDGRDAEDACKDFNGKELRGKALRIEMSGGEKKRGPPAGGRNDECFGCGETGHFARDCPSKRGGDRGRSPPRRRSSRSPPRRSRSPPRRGSRSPPRRSRSPPRRATSLRRDERRRSPSPRRDRSPPRREERRRSPSPRRRSRSPRR